jgi:DNA-directed RNA polymerase subunit RPC12/RpoP
MNQGRTVGWIMIFVGVVVFLLAISFVGSGYFSGKLELPGAVLGMILFGALPLLILAGVGSYLMVKGKAEARRQDLVKKQERLLGMIQVQGQVPLGNAMLELAMSREEITNAIYELVNLGLFTGYIDWEAMIFYSREAAAVGTNKCPNCGGIREFVGQGVIKCPYCGVSLFIPPGTPERQARPVPPTDTG